MVFSNIPIILFSIFQGVSFNYHQRNVRSGVSVSSSVSSFQVSVSVSAFMAKPRSRSFSQVSVSFSVSEVTVSTTSLLVSFFTTAADFLQVTVAFVFKIFSFSDREKVSGVAFDRLQHAVAHDTCVCGPQGLNFKPQPT